MNVTFSLFLVGKYSGLGRYCRDHYFGSMSKKRKLSETQAVVIQSRQVRPIDKELKYVNQTCTNSQTSSTLKTTTFPCTVVGLRWSLSFVTNLTTGSPTINWALVVVRDGLSASTLAISDAADFYTPEQQCLAFGVAHLADIDGTTGPRIQRFEGSTKTMRKLKQGDVMQLICLGDTASTGTLKGVVQFFCKS